jgi:ferredoxin
MAVTNQDDGEDRGGAEQASVVAAATIAVDFETGLAIEVAPAASLLQAIEAGALTTLSIGCRNGGCGICRVRVLSGTYEKGKMSRKFVSVAAEQERVALACKVYPTGRLVYRREPLLAERRGGPAKILQERER